MTDPDPYAALGTVEGAAPPQAAGDPYAALGVAEQPKLHTYAARKSDGTVVQFQLPEDAPDQLVREHSAKVTGNNAYLRATVDRSGSPPPQTDDSAVRGFLGGLEKPIDNLAGWVDSIPGVHEAGDAIAHVTGLPTTAEANASHDAARENNTRTGWQQVGTIAGTLPFGSARLGLAANGAIQGALASDAKSAGGTLVDAGVGAVGGAIGGRLLQGLGTAVAPVVNRHVATLLNNGVRPTMGQIARVGQGVASRVIANTEDRATTLPIAGEAITGARDATATQFRRGAVQQALTPIGIRLPDHLETGHGMIHFAQRTISRAYDDALSRMQMVPDGQLAADFTALDQRVQNGGLSPAFQRRLNTEFHGNLMRRVYGNGTGMMDGGELQTTLSSLRQKAQRFGASQDAEQQEYGGVLSEIADHIEAAAARSSPPEAVAARDAANEAYAHLVRVEGAAKNAIEGDFSPAQLDVAVRSGATRVRGRDASAGQALMQDYSTAARRVLSSQTGSSGTAERLSTINPFKWAAGAALAPGQTIADRYLVPALTRQPGPNARRAADLLRLMAPAAGAVASPLAVTATQ